ncbi:zinc-ribbon domain-containing protein [Feifania hominis]|uniref:Zinc-ribbon domain-containing protein n=1 Tax=Feifania hominis TaxID=2763660 RepID=A0A926DFD9_9FIRM|nr:zinc-ribbon domain-containing protein [Feifania hominis]MBC8536279.1 zinc-ribbon domain-containing protein [Feifania hominis]
MQTSFEPICPLCGGPFDKTRLIVLCPSCHVMYHHDCWEKNDGCAISGCPLGPGDRADREQPSQTGDDVIVPHALPPKGEQVIEPPAAPADEAAGELSPGVVAHCTSCGAELLPDARFCRRCGCALEQRPPEPAAAPPHATPVPDGKLPEPVAVPLAASEPMQRPAEPAPISSSEPAVPVHEPPAPTDMPPGAMLSRAVETCPKCGKKLKEGYAFCPRCGTPLES